MNQLQFTSPDELEEMIEGLLGVQPEEITEHSVVFSYTRPLGYIGPIPAISFLQHKGVSVTPLPPDYHDNLTQYYSVPLDELLPILSELKEASDFNTLKTHTFTELQLTLEEINPNNEAILSYEVFPWENEPNFGISLLYSEAGRHFQHVSTTITNNNSIRFTFKVPLSSLLKVLYPDTPD